MKIFQNKKILGLAQLVLLPVLWWVFFAKNGPGFYVLVFFAAIFWRDPLMEAITGKNILDTTVFNVRAGQIIYATLELLYFLGAFVLLIILTWKAVRNILARGEVAK
jgi:hypothetical protein